MDVHASLSIGVVAGDVVGDGGGRRLGALLERDSAGDFRVSSEDGDCSDASVLAIRSIVAEATPYPPKVSLLGVDTLRARQIQGWNASSTVTGCGDWMVTPAEAWLACD